MNEQDMITGWYGNVTIENNEQHKIALDTANLFELHRTQEHVTEANIINEMRQHYPPRKLFTNKIITNKDLLGKMLKHFIGLGFTVPSELRQNERTQIKLAHSLYPGEKFRSERTECLDRITNFFQTGDASKTDEGTSSSQNTCNTENTTEETINKTNEGKHGTDEDLEAEKDSSTDIQKLFSMMMSISAKIDKQDNKIETTLTNFQAQLNDLRSEKQKVAPKSDYPMILGHSESNTNIKSTTTKPTEQLSDNYGYDQSSRKNRLHHDIHQRFKDRENKFGGDESDDLFEHFTIYERVAKDYELSEDNMFQYSHNLFKKEALRYINTFVTPETVDYQEAKKMMFRHFVSPDIQNRVKNELQSLRFSEFVKQEGSKPKALQKLANHISNNYMKCPITYRNEANRVEFLKRALQKEKWASTILYKINDITQFQSLYADLANALQFELERLGDRQESDDEQHSATPNSKPTILFTQPRYAKQVTGKFFNGYKNDDRCWNCDRKSHHHTKCRLPINPIRIAAAKARFLERKKSKAFRRDGMSPTKQVLYELTEELKDLMGTKSDSDRDQSANVFFGINKRSDTDADSSESDKTDDQSTAENYFTNEHYDKDF